MTVISTVLFLAQQAPTPPTPPAPEGKSLLEHIASGGPIGYVIIGLSIIAVALIVMHMLQIRPSRLSPPLAVEDLQRMLRKHDVRGAIIYCQDPGNDSFLTRVMGSALTRCSRSSFGFLELRSALEEEGQEQVARLYRATDGLGLIASVAPMLGLLGTVVGMVGAFDTISTAEGFARPDELAGSISVALITTVLGLIVAIPCTAVFTYFRNRIDHYASEVSQTIEELAANLEASATDPRAAATQPVPTRAAPVSSRQAAPNRGARPA